MKFTDLHSQYLPIKDKIEARIAKVLEHGQYVMGPEVYELEAALAKYVGVKHCVTTSSGTNALMLSLMTLGIKCGDSVVTTPLSFFATAEVIAFLGAKPVFVDVDHRTYNLDPDKLQNAIRKNNAKAVIPVSLYGQCANFDEINIVCNRLGVPIVEDGAQSFGAIYKGKKSCSLSEIGCTSFFPSKPLGTYGDGGACFTNDDELANKLRILRSHGETSKYNHVSVGTNSRFNTIQAAILLEKLEVFDAEVASRQAIAELYDKQLSTVVTTPFIELGSKSVYAQYTVQVDDRDSVMKKLADKDVPTMVHYPIPMHKQIALAYLGYGDSSLPVAEKVVSRVLSLPMHPNLSYAEQLKVIDRLIETVRGR